jgi:hypothetical protein
MRFIGPGDDEWPSGLDDLRHAESVQRRGGVPVGLWLRRQPASTVEGNSQRSAINSQRHKLRRW